MGYLSVIYLLFKKKIMFKGCLIKSLSFKKKSRYLWSNSFSPDYRATVLASKMMH